MTNDEIIASVARWQSLSGGYPLKCVNDRQHQALHAIDVDGHVILECLDCGSQRAHIPDMVKQGLF